MLNPYSISIFKLIFDSFLNSVLNSICSQDWQQQYELYTREQQLYFIAYIVAVTTSIKCIDIEFENQPVALPIFTSEFNTSDFAGRLINANASERALAKKFKYSVIPPDVDISGFKSTISKTKILQKVYAPSIGAARPTFHQSQRPNIQEIYVQDSQFSVLLHSIDYDNRMCCLIIMNYIISHFSMSAKGIGSFCILVKHKRTSCDWWNVFGYVNLIISVENRACLG